MSLSAEKKIELENELSKLTILQLRELARKHSIDVTGSIRKKELIDKILNADVKLNEETLAAAFSKGIATQEHPKSEARPEPSPVKEPPKIEMFAPPPKKEKKVELSDQKVAEIKEYINSVRNSKPTFFEVDAKLEAAAAKHSAGNYYGAIKDIQEARRLAAEKYSLFRIYTNALGINSSEKALEEAIKRGSISQQRAKELMQTAMDGFVDGTPARREETLDNLESESIAAFDKLIGDIGRTLEVKQKQANELKNLGANVLQPIELLKEADNLRLALRVDEAKARIELAEELLKKATIARMEEIRYQIPKVRASIEEAKSIGLNVKGPELDLEKANYCFEQGDLKLCVEALVKAEFAVDQAVGRAFTENPGLRQGQLEKANAIIQKASPAIKDAASYGIDVSEGQHYIMTTQMALNRNDSLNSPKFARRVEELSKRYEEDVKLLRNKSKQVENLKCPQCGQEMIYDYPNSFRRCSNCTWSTKIQ